MKNKIPLVMIAGFVAASTACSLIPGGGNAATNAGPNANAAQSTDSNNSNPDNSTVSVQNTAASAKPAVDSCGEPKMAGKTLIKKQTFPIDFKPFAGACFVTFGSKDDMLDENDVPRGSTFYVYRDGKQIFEFPDAFGGQPACWIEGISFKDLNGDGLTDVALAGSCLSARNSYPSNALYVNTGSGFTTNDDANTKLETFKTVKAIEEFVRKNVNTFFK